METLPSVEAMSPTAFGEAGWRRLRRNIINSKALIETMS
jgi:hypothetical protein